MDISTILSGIRAETAQHGREIVVLGDPSGVIYRVTGGKSSVSFPRWAETEATWHAHTHPSNSAPSPQDVFNGMQMGTLNYVALPDGTVYEYRCPVIRSITRAALTRNYNATWRSGAPSHEAFLAICKRYGVQYRIWSL